MNNYYEILEVSKNASKEVIEKAYKVLVKKYHPDLYQEESQKKMAEQKMKLINEAYDVLSEDEKRKNYDLELEEQARELERQKNEQENKRKDNVINEEPVYYEEEPVLTKKEIKEQIKQEKRAQRQYQEEQERIYRNYMRSLGYRVKERWTWSRFVRTLKMIGLIAIAILIIWIFPPTHKLLLQTYEENPLIKSAVDIIGNIIKGFVSGIWLFIKNIFT